jgi:1-acyl-sn-glycerol-3-phosphate acyltransferase
MKLLKLLFKWVYNLYAISLFIGLMLVVFPFVIAVVPMGRIRGGNLILRFCRYWADIWYSLVLIRHESIIESPIEKDKAYIFVGNHNSYIDAAVIVKALRINFRALGRAESSSVPIFGYIYRHAIVTVDRSSPENRAASVNLLKAYIKKGISVVVFPEGTFNMSASALARFYDGAFKVAIETQTPIKPMLLLDSFDRMHYSSIISLTPGKSRVVFLETIPVAGYTLDDLPALKEQVYTLMEKKLHEYNAPWIQKA